MEKILLRLGNKQIMLVLDEIDWIKADRKYSRFYVNDSSYLICKHLKLIEEKLNSDKFIRISKSALVNINKIKEFNTESNNNVYVLLNNNEKIKCSRNFKKNLNLVEL